MKKKELIKQLKDSELYHSQAFKAATDPERRDFHLHMMKTTAYAQDAVQKIDDPLPVDPLSTALFMLKQCAGLLAYTQKLLNAFQEKGEEE